MWFKGFDRSTFCADESGKVASECPSGSPEYETWVEPSADYMPDNRNYRVEFNGRKTVHAGHFGHMGVYAHEIVVDRMISMKPVGAKTKG